MRRLARTSALIVLSFGFAVLLSDLALHFTAYDAFRNVRYFNDGLFIDDPELGAVMSANFEKAWFEFIGPGHWVFTNQLGCFDHPIDLELEDYILFIGDSATWGYTPLEKKFTTLIENELGVRTLKCGVSGTGSRYQLGILKRILARMKHPPRFVVQVYNANDFNDDFVFPGHRVIEGQRVQSFASIDLNSCERVEREESSLRRQTKIRKARVKNRSLLERHSVIYGLVKNARNRIRGPSPNKRTNRSDVDDPATMTKRYSPLLRIRESEESGCIRTNFDLHLSAIEATQSFVRRSGSAYVLVAVGWDGGDPGTYAAEFRAFVGRTIQHHDKITGPRSSHRFDTHWDERGNAIAAESILASLREMGLAAR